LSAKGDPKKCGVFPGGCVAGSSRLHEVHSVNGTVLLTKMKRNETHKMKTKLTTSFAMFALMLATLFVTGCSTTEPRGSETTGTHQMGAPKTGYPMSNSVMPQRR
jgi:hypothetical protein